MTGSLIPRYLVEYARRPLNLMLLAVVPVVFVALSAGALADFAQILGGTADLGQLEVATAGWAAAFLAGVAGFFHVSSSRPADRRLAAAGDDTRSVVLARTASSTLLAAVAAVGALAALWLRTDVADLGRAVGGTVMFAVIYLAVGVAVGAVVRSEINGSLVIIFFWMLDVFLGPAMGPTQSSITRFFPGHFPTLVMLDAASGHAGPLGDVGAALAWTAGALVVAGGILMATTRPQRGHRSAKAGGRRARVAAGLGAAWDGYRRNLALWVLLAGLPPFFITLSIAVTPDTPAPVQLVEGDTAVRILSMVDVHGAIMVPITVAFLAGLAGLFVVLSSAQADRRLVIAGFRPWEILTGRFTVIVAAALLVSAVSLAVTSASFDAEDWGMFGVATFAVAVTYTMIGVVVGPLVGRVGGLYLMFLLPFLDAGLAQNIMFDAAPPSWAAWMPAHGAVRVLVDSAFTPTLDETGALWLAVAWLGGVTAAAAVVFHRLAAART